MTNWAQIFTGLLFYAYDGIHQVRRLVFDNYQTCTVPFNNNNDQSTGRILLLENTMSYIKTYIAVTLLDEFDHS